MKNKHALGAALHEQEVTAITFIHDYFQIQLSDATISIYWWPYIISTGATYRFDDPEFATVARKLILQTIDSVACSAKEFELTFSNGSTLHVVFEQKDTQGPEAVSIQTSGAEIWVAP